MKIQELNESKIRVDIIKLDLIRYIMKIRDASRLKKMDFVIRNMGKSTNQIDINKYVNPMRDHLDVEELKIEQDYKPIDKKVFFDKIRKLNIDEPIDELLEMIK